MNMGKYDPLFRYLQQIKDQQIRLSYTEVEEIIGTTLPTSASKDNRWWLNNDKTHAQSSAWGNAGFVVQKVVLGEYVIFSKE